MKTPIYITQNDITDWKIIPADSERGILLKKSVDKMLDVYRIENLKNIILPKFDFPIIHAEKIHDEIKKSLMNNGNKYILSESLKKMFNKDFERFNEQMREMSLTAKNFQESIKKEFEKLPNSSKTKKQGCFTYNLKTVLTSNNKIDNIKDIQINLKEKLDRKKQYKFKNNENIQMAHEFAGNLNDCFLYFNHILINVKVLLGDNSPSLYGAKKDKEINKELIKIKLDIEKLKNSNPQEEVILLDNIKDFLHKFENKINDNLSIDGNANNVQVIINNIIKNEKDSAKQKKLKNVRDYFSILEVIIRNFYSHGWIDIFPLICLNSSKEYPILNIGYHKKDELIKIHVNIFNEELFKKSLDYLSKQDDFVNMVENNNSFSNMIENITLDTALARSFLRKISVSCGKSFDLFDFPHEIIIYSNDRKNSNIILSEEEIFKQMNIFLEILNEQLS